MTTKMIYRVTCDAPLCAATDVIEKARDTPDGWRKIDSAAHLADWKPPLIKLRNGRTRESKLELWDVTSGSFQLHLCPEHLSAFDEHLPQTEGGALSGRRERAVNVRCSCGTPIRWQYDITLIQNKPEPNRCPEREWWRHLPAVLQEYATRGAK